jgi:hypothetical protein
MEALSQAGRYPEGAFMRHAARGMAAFTQGEFGEAIALLSPVAAELERLGGSRAQLDMVEGTLVRACVEAGRFDEMTQRLAARRAKALNLPLAGVH